MSSYITDITDVFLYFIPVLLLIPCGYFFRRMVSAFVVVKHHKGFTFFALIAFSCITQTVIFNQDIVNISYAFIALCLVLLLCFEGSLLQKISAAFILYPFVSSVNYLSDYLLWLWVPEEGSITLVVFVIRIVRLLLSILIWFTLDRIFRQRISSFKQYATKQMWILLDVVSCAPLLLTAYIIITTPNSMQPFSVPIIGIGLMTQFGILYLITYMVENARISIENESLKSQQQYYQELEHNQLEIRKLRHDMNNHLSAIEALINDGQIEKARKYFASLSNTARGVGRTFCKNSLVNAVLASKYQQADALGIDSFFHIDLDSISLNQTTISSAHAKDISVIPMPDVELCSLLSNTLDNAIEACGKIKEPSLRKIEVKARCANGFFSYQVENSYIGELIQKNGQFLSSKSAPNHGLGLSRVEDIVHKYNGTLDINAESGLFTVTCIVPLKE